VIHSVLKLLMYSTKKHWLASYQKVDHPLQNLTLAPLFIINNVIHSVLKLLMYSTKKHWLASYQKVDHPLQNLTLAPLFVVSLSVLWVSFVYLAS